MAIYLDTTQCIPYYIEPDTQGAASVYLSDLFLRIRRQELKGGGKDGAVGPLHFQGDEGLLVIGNSKSPFKYKIRIHQPD